LFSAKTKKHDRRPITSLDPISESMARLSDWMGSQNREGDGRIGPLDPLVWLTVWRWWWLFVSLKEPWAHIHETSYGNL